jgi:hypothetical protein
MCIRGVDREGDEPKRNHFKLLIVGSTSLSSFHSIPSRRYGWPERPHHNNCTRHAPPPPHSSIQCWTPNLTAHTSPYNRPQNHNPPRPQAPERQDGAVQGQRLHPLRILDVVPFCGGPDPDGGAKEGDGRGACRKCCSNVSWLRVSLLLCQPSSPVATHARTHASTHTLMRTYAPNTRNKNKRRRASPWTRPCFSSWI